MEPMNFTAVSTMKLVSKLHHPLLSKENIKIFFEVSMGLLSVVMIVLYKRVKVIDPTS